jgi:integrase
MSSNSSSTSVVMHEPGFADPERQALFGYLAGYRGLTRDAYVLDLRQFAAWCRQQSIPLFGARRADIEGYARWLEDQGRARATVARRLSTVAGFYRYAEEEGLLERSPAVHVRRPRLDYESHALALDRNEVGALLVAAGLGTPIEHALLSLLALNGLRISEALGTDIEALGVQRGHRTLTILRKGGKLVTIPLAPRTARRPGHRGTGQWTDLRLARRPPPRPPRCRQDRSPSGTASRDHQASRSPHLAPRLYHRRPRRRRTPARRPRSSVACRPSHHHALRPGPSIP